MTWRLPPWSLLFFFCLSSSCIVVLLGETDRVAAVDGRTEQKNPENMNLMHVRQYKQPLAWWVAGSTFCHAPRLAGWTAQVVVTWVGVCVFVWLVEDSRSPREPRL